MAAKFGNMASPRNEGAAVTPSDTTVIGGPDGALLYVGGTGNVTVTLAGPGQSVVTFNAVPAGSWMPILVTKVMAATTATLITAVW